MAGYPPPYPPPPPGTPYGPPNGRDWKYQRRILRDQARAQRDQYRLQMRGMRRGSILGPVLVILVGIVFLLVQTGRLHRDHVWEWYGHWWPLLLVLAGAVLLIEWGIDQVRPQDPQRLYVRRSVGGGVITLLVLLAVVGVIFKGVHDGRDSFARGFSINPDNIEEFLGNKHESDANLVEALPAGTSLSIDNPRGDVTVTGTSTDNQVHISVHKQVFSRSDSDAEEKAGRLTPQVNNNNHQLSITMPSLNGAITDITMTVPPGAASTIMANHGEVHVDSLKAPVAVTSNHGDVKLSAILGPVTAHVNNNGSSFSAHDITGPLALEGHAQDMTISDINGPVNLTGDFYGTTHLEHITSAVRFHTSRTDFQLARLDGEMEISSDGISADQAAGPVVLTTANRNVNLERMSGDLAVTNRNGSIDLTSAPPLGNVTVQNRNGSVNLTLPDHANFVASAETTDGSIENDFSLPRVDHEQKATMNGTVGKGGPLIRITTSQGDVSFKKASIAPLPIRPPMPPMPPAPPGHPQVSISGDDGSSVYVGRDGVRIISGADGSSVIVGKDGLKITASADGSSVYKGKDGTQLTEGADGSKTFISPNGTRYSQQADGSRALTSSDGTRITTSADGSETGRGPGGKELSKDEILARLLRAEQDVKRAEQRRDSERRDQQSHK